MENSSFKKLGKAIAISDYGYKHLTVDAISSILPFLPCIAYETDDAATIDKKRLIQLENLESEEDWIHPDMLIVELDESEKLVSKSNWEQFRETGLLLFINQFLHIFGWAIVLEIEDGIVTNSYPARVKYRGFDEESTTDAYKKLSSFMLENAKRLNDDANS